MKINLTNDPNGALHFNIAGVKTEILDHPSGANEKAKGLAINAANAFKYNQGRSSLEQRKALAQKQAMHIVSEAFKGERGLDKTIDSLNEDAEKLRKSINEKVNENSDIAERLSALQEEYGIDPDGEEQKKLEALSAKLLYSDEGLSAQERNRLTEYQQRALDITAKSKLNDQELGLEKEMMKATLDGVRSIKKERLKSDPIGEAEKQADELMDAANKEALHGLLQDGKEHLDEIQEEEKEKAAEKAKEKKEEDLKEARELEKEAIQEELIEKARAASESSETAEAKRAAASEKRNNSEIESLTGETTGNAIDIAEMQTVQAAVTSEVNNVLNKLSLLSEDLKGAALDDKL